jgi:hypothetical protein
VLLVGGKALLLALMGVYYSVIAYLGAQGTHEAGMGSSRPIFPRVPPNITPEEWRCASSEPPGESQRW